MNTKMKVLIVACATAIAVTTFIATRPEPQPLAFLDRYPLEAIYVAQGDHTSTTGQTLLCRTYAIKGSVAEIRRQLSAEVKRQGMTYTLENGEGSTWMKENRSLSVLVIEKVPRILTGPTPGANGYVVAYEPMNEPLSQRLWRVWWRFTHR